MKFVKKFKSLNLIGKIIFLFSIIIACLMFTDYIRLTNFSLIPKGFLVVVLLLFFLKRPLFKANKI